jgi:hypothetical protein
MLCQANRAQPDAKLNEVADSLTSLLIADSRVPSNWNGMSPGMLGAWAALTRAGDATGQQPGRPYPCALAGLARIYHEADPRDAIRIMAVTRIHCTSDLEGGLQQMREAAMSLESVAYFVVDELAVVAAGGTGTSCHLPASQRLEVRAILEELWRRRVVRRDDAQARLARYAATLGRKASAGGTVMFDTTFWPRG